MSEPVFRGDLVYKKERIVAKPKFSDQLKRIIKCYKSVGHIMDIVRQSACLVVNPITVDSYGLLFHCTTVGQTSDLKKALTVGWCLMLVVAVPTEDQLKVFFSSDYL